jgi:hypothetical protein
MVRARAVRKSARGQMTSAADIRRHLGILAEERVLAHECGLDDDPAYMADLESEIAATRAAYVGEAVTEIASLRAALGGMLYG